MAVIGGGPIGMRAAVLAAQQGHSVTLYEKRAQLGGKARYAQLYPFKWPIRRYLEWLEGEDGHRTLCIYSLGNFISGQHKRPTMLGGILEVELLFDPDGSLLETVSAGVIPTVTHYKSGGGYTVYPLSEYTAELAAEHGVKKYESALTLDYLNNLTQEILGENAITWEGEHD